LAGKKQPTPFDLWRDEQRDLKPEPVADPPRVELSPGRHAQRALAIDRMLTALHQHGQGSPEYEQASEDIVELNHRLYLEQQAELEAEHGLIPDTPEGRLAILKVAALITEALADGTIAA
jgi:hypothetical protein